MRIPRRPFFTLVAGVLLLGSSAPSREAVQPNGPKVLDNPLSYYATPDHYAELRSLADSAKWWKGEKTVSILPELLHGKDGCVLDDEVTITPAKKIKGFIHKRDGHEKVDDSELDSEPNGVLLGIIHNKTSCVVLPLNIGPGKWYWVAFKESDNVYKSRLISRTDPSMTVALHLGKCPTEKHQDNDLANAYLKAGPSGTEDVCNHSFMASLTRSPDARAAARKTLRANKAGKLHPFDENFALWFSCYDGCCYADGF